MNRNDARRDRARPGDGPQSGPIQNREGCPKHMPDLATKDTPRSSPNRTERPAPGDPPIPTALARPLNRALFENDFDRALDLIATHMRDKGLTVSRTTRDRIPVAEDGARRQSRPRP